MDGHKHFGQEVIWFLSPVDPVWILELHQSLSSSLYLASLSTSMSSLCLASSIPRYSRWKWKLFPQCFSESVQHPFLFSNQQHYIEKFCIQGWQTLCGLLLYKILTVTGKSNFKVICRTQIREVLAAWQPSPTYNLWRWPPSTGPPWFHFFLVSSSSPLHLSPAQRPWLGYATFPSIIFRSSSWRSNPLAPDTNTCVRERLELCPSRGLPDRQDLSCWCTGGSSNMWNKFFVIALLPPYCNRFVQY